MDEHAAAIMKMLRAGGPKIIRYEKASSRAVEPPSPKERCSLCARFREGQLLSISRLAAGGSKRAPEAATGSRLRGLQREAGPGPFD